MHVCVCVCVCLCMCVCRISYKISVVMEGPELTLSDFDNILDIFEECPLLYEPLVCVIINFGYVELEFACLSG